MGACNFRNFGTGDTAAEAFYNARLQQSGTTAPLAYSGDISAKDDYIEASVPKGIEPTIYANWIEAASEIFSCKMDDEKAGKILKLVPEQYQARVLQFARIYANKWDDTVCIRLADQPNRNEGRYLFLGIAPE